MELVNAASHRNLHFDRPVAKDAGSHQKVVKKVAKGCHKPIKNFV